MKQLNLLKTADPKVAEALEPKKPEIFARGAVESDLAQGRRVPQGMIDILATLDVLRDEVDRLQSKERFVSALLPGMLHRSITESDGLFDAVDVIFDEIDPGEYAAMVGRLRGWLGLPEVDEGAVEARAVENGLDFGDFDPTDEVGLVPSPGELLAKLFGHQNIDFGDLERRVISQATGIGGDEGVEHRVAMVVNLGGEEPTDEELAVVLAKQLGVDPAAVKIVGRKNVGLDGLL